MLKKRKDGQLVKMDPMFKVIPLVMEDRVDAQVYYGQDVPIEAMDQYIQEKKKEGISIGYMHIYYAALIRAIKERPQLNQFIMNGRLYRRNTITISLMVKKDLSLEGEETSVKIDFTGNESPEDVKNILNDYIEKDKNDGNEDVEKFLKIFDKIPQGLLKYFARFVKFLDRHNFMPNSIIEASPFHATAFVNSMGSIGLDSIFHHIYNFGTIGIFLSIGKKGRHVKMKNGEPVEEKTMSIAFVSDERICDGFYYASSIRLFLKYIKNPKLLDHE